MRYEKLSVGIKPPHDINVVIEVPMGGDPIKYEIDKASNALMVDRFMFTAMRYPCNYGFVPHTLSDDGDPLDVLCHCNCPLLPNAVVNARPVGVLLMEDEKGIDEKILAVPSRRMTDQFNEVRSFKDMNEALCRQIEHFFEHYKDLETDKWVKIIGWRDESVARHIIQEAIERVADKAA